MPRRELFMASVLSRHGFETPAKARALFEFFDAADEAFRPAKYGASEPVRKEYNPDDLDEPVRYLTGREGRGGSVFLKGARHGFVAWIRWGRGEVGEWYFQLNPSFFAKPAQVEKFVQFARALCEDFPPLYGGAAHEEDWKRKHWLVKETPSGGTSRERVGVEVGACLPGVYWLTAFGPAAVKHFGAAKLKALPVHRVEDAGRGGLVAVLRESPLAPDADGRLRHDAEVAALLGADHFFDIAKRRRKCRPVPGVTGHE